MTVNLDMAALGAVIYDRFQKGHSHEDVPPLELAILKAICEKPTAVSMKRYYHLGEPKLSVVIDSQFSKHSFTSTLSEEDPQAKDAFGNTLKMILINYFREQDCFSSDDLDELLDPIFLFDTVRVIPHAAHLRAESPRKIAQLKSYDAFPPKDK